MLLPPKALNLGQLKKVGDASLPASGHKVSKVEFKDSDGQVKIGFFKPIDHSTYPPLLAKYSVAISVAIRLALGEKAAEDRLVFSDDGNALEGTLSINLPHYKPLCTSIAPLPSNPQAREEVAPSCETLLFYNVAELLVNAWRYKCDDRHPGNFSLYGLIDWDMCLYPYTYIIKGGRLSDEITSKQPEKAMKLEFKDLDNFPIIDNRTHWPANNTPGNGNILKKYSAFAAFQALASNQSVRIGNKEVSFQEQVFSALLKELVTYDPKVLRERLILYLGDSDLLLNYTALADPKKIALLSKTYPNLFNEKTNSEPFIDHILKVFDKEYEEFYNTVIHYPGCRNNKNNTPVVSFQNFLNSRPSAYRHIQTFIDGENTKQLAYRTQQELATKPLEKSKSLHLTSSKFRFDYKKSLTTLSLSQHFFSANIKENKEKENSVGSTPSISGCFNQSTLEKRYHQIWRDTHLNSIFKLIQDAEILTKQLANELRLEPKDLNYAQRPVLPTAEELEKWKNSSQLIDESSNLQCDKKNRLRFILSILEKFTNSLNSCTKEYFKIDWQVLQESDNARYHENLNQVIKQAESNLFQPFLRNSIYNTWIEQFDDFLKRLQHSANSINFSRHLFSKDTPLNASFETSYSISLLQQYTVEETIKVALPSLFKWVNTLDSDRFSNILSNIVNFHYKPQGLSFGTKHRSKAVLSYLKTRQDDNANCLALILSEGKNRPTSLNTQIIKQLVSLITQDKNFNFQTHWLSIAQALDRGKFDPAFYAFKAQRYAQQDPGFDHFFSRPKISLFKKTLYESVDTLSEKAFRSIINRALSKYKSKISIFSHRETEVKQYLEHSPHYKNIELLTIMLRNGGNAKNSFNTILLECLLNTLKVENQNNPDWKFMAQLKEKHLLYYGIKMKEETGTLSKALTDYGYDTGENDSMLDSTTLVKFAS